MVFTRTFRAFVCQFLVGVVLFAQAAAYAYACAEVPAAKSPPSASAAVAGPGCDHLDPQSPNLCVEHCRPDQQSADTARSTVVAATLASLLYSRPPNWETALPADRPAAAQDIDGAPPPPLPHAVVHCVLRL